MHRDVILNRTRSTESSPRTAYNRSVGMSIHYAVVAAIVTARRRDTTRRDVFHAWTALGRYLFRPRAASIP